MMFHNILYALTAFAAGIPLTVLITAAGILLMVFFAVYRLRRLFLFRVIRALSFLAFLASVLFLFLSMRGLEPFTAGLIRL
jgi:hypothetical protein